jgi:hypothetical protein
MGAVKPGFGPKEPTGYKTSGGCHEDVLLVMQERRERCKDCSNDRGRICCGCQGGSTCDMFTKLCVARASGISNGRFVILPHERVLKQNDLVDPCDRCPVYHSQCLGRTLVDQEIAMAEAGLLTPEYYDGTTPAFKAPSAGSYKDRILAMRARYNSRVGADVSSRYSTEEESQRR